MQAWGECHLQRKPVLRLTHVENETTVCSARCIEVVSGRGHYDVAFLMIFTYGLALNLDLLLGKAK